MRFVLSPDGTVVPDLRRRLPGRGVWVTARYEDVAKAVQKRAFARGFKAQAGVPDTLADDVAALMRKAALERLSLANKAGHVTSGFEKVASEVAADRVAGFVFAVDGAADSRRRLRALANSAANRHNRVWWIDVFSSAELERSLGRERVVNVALSPGRPSELFFSDARRLAAYFNGSADGAGLPDEQPDEPRFAGPLTV